MAHVITLATSKGGTGKTTTVLNLGVALAEKGRRTILVDLDPQGALGLAMGKGDREWIGVAEWLAGSEPLDKVTLKTKVPTLTVLPRGRLDPVDVGSFEALLRNSGQLAELVEEIRRDYDYVFLDTPSGLGPATRSALSVTDFVLVPLQAEPLALRSFGQTMRVMDHVQAQENPGLRLLGVLPTMVELDHETCLNVMGTVWAELGGVLETAVPRARVFTRASEMGLPVSFLAGKTPPEARRFAILAEEIEAVISEMTEGEADATLPRELI